jgi:hypothetical protein
MILYHSSGLVRVVRQGLIVDIDRYTKCVYIWYITYLILRKKTYVRTIYYIRKEGGGGGGLRGPKKKSLTPSP